MNSRVDCQPKTTPASSDSSRSYLIQPQKRKKNSRNFADIIKLQSPQATKRGFRNSSPQADLTRGNIFINLLSVFLLLPLESSDSCWFFSRRVIV
jgi:hypothetical protein